MTDEQKAELEQLAADMEQAVAFLRQVNAALRKTLDYKDVGESTMERLVDAQIRSR